MILHKCKVQFDVKWYILNDCAVNRYYIPFIFKINFKADVEPDITYIHNHVHHPWKDFKHDFSDWPEASHPLCLAYHKV